MQVATFAVQLEAARKKEDWSQMEALFSQYKAHGGPALGSAVATPKSNVTRVEENLETAETAPVSTRTIEIQVGATVLKTCIVHIKAGFNAVAVIFAYRVTVRMPRNGPNQR